MIWRGPGHQEAGPISLSNLKVCDLCGALNLAANRQCFVCSWHGRFERRPEIVHLALELMERRHGVVDISLLTDSSRSNPVHRFTFRISIGRLFYRIRRSLFG